MALRPSARAGHNPSRAGQQPARPAFEDRGPGRSPGDGAHSARPLLKGRSPSGGAPGKDRGSASVEFLGFLPVLLLVALAALHLGLAAFAAQQAGTGARAAARTATLDEPEATPAGAGGAAMTGWVADHATVAAQPCTAADTRITATVTVTVPALIPGADFTVTRRATMPCPAAATAIAAPGGAP